MVYVFVDPPYGFPLPTTRCFCPSPPPVSPYPLKPFGPKNFFYRQPAIFPSPPLSLYHVTHQSFLEAKHLNSKFDNPLIPIHFILRPYFIFVAPFGFPHEKLHPRWVPFLPDSLYFLLVQLLLRVPHLFHFCDEQTAVLPPFAGCHSSHRMESFPKLQLSRLHQPSSRECARKKMCRPHHHSEN